jgi:hypothetical protein
VNVSTVGAQYNATNYVQSVANSAGGYFEAFAGTKQILLSANTLSASQALTLRNWGSVAAPIYVASTEVVDLSKVTGNCWAGYTSSTLTLGNATCPVQTVQMLGTENGSEGIFLEKTNSAGSVKIGDLASAKFEAYYQSNNSVNSRIFVDIANNNTSVEANYVDYTSWLDSFNDQCSFGSAYKYATSTSYEARGTVFSSSAEFRTYKYGGVNYESRLYTDASSSAVYAFGGASTIKSSLYSESTSTAITAEYSSTIKARMGANSTYSDFYTTSSTNSVLINASTNSSLTVQNLSATSAGPASKSITMSIADIVPATAVVKLREFSICVNGETKKCMILASDYYT